MCGQQGGDPSAPFGPKASCPHDLKQEWSGECVKSLGDVELQQQHWDLLLADQYCSPLDIFEVVVNGSGSDESV